MFAANVTQVIEDRVRYFFDFSISRPPTARECAVLTARLGRLAAMELSVADATERMRELVAGRTTDTGDLRLRHRMLRLHSPNPDANTLDRKVTDRHHRPPATRLISPRGRTPSFLLTTLLEAQMRLASGQSATRNELPVKAENSHDGWTNYVATDAKDATQGKVLMSVRGKKVRQIQSSLARLASENLIHLPEDDSGHRQYDDFVLKREDAAHSGDNDFYTVPDDANEYFTVPLALFTNGWIHVLEDSELIMLLIGARFRHAHGDEPQPLAPGPRKLNYGLSHDSFEAGHRMLDYLGILDVISDYQRSRDGKVDGYKDRGAKPHVLRFRPETLDTPAYPTIIDVITRQLARSEAS